MGYEREKSENRSSDPRAQEPSTLRIATSERAGRTNSEHLLARKSLFDNAADLAWHVLVSLGVRPTGRMT